MCPMANMCELRDRPQKGNIEKKVPENPLKEESSGTTTNVCRYEEYFFEKSRDSKEEETDPSEITILHTKEENIILKTEEDPRKPWYFVHV
jgi:hypothetical protein